MPKEVPVDRRCEDLLKWNQIILLMFVKRKLGSFNKVFSSNQYFKKSFRKNPVKLFLAISYIYLV